jgi:hypothetical protein
LSGDPNPVITVTFVNVGSDTLVLCKNKELKRCTYKADVVNNSEYCNGYTKKFRENTPIYDGTTYGCTEIAN